MALIDRKIRAFHGLIRLRRAERQLPPNEDLVAVRSLLEDDLGETMSRRLAARLLGVHHRSITRWIDSGDLPVIHTAAGKTEVPVSNVIELYEAVTDTRQDGSRKRHVLEPSLTAGRKHADSLRPNELVDQRGTETNPGAVIAAPTSGVWLITERWPNACGAPWRMTPSNCCGNGVTKAPSTAATPTNGNSCCIGRCQRSVA